MDQQFSRSSKASGWECSGKRPHSTLSSTHSSTLFWDGYPFLASLKINRPFPLILFNLFFASFLSAKMGNRSYLLLCPFIRWGMSTYFKRKILAKAISYGNSDIPLQDQLCCWIFIEWNHMFERRRRSICARHDRIGAFIPLWFFIWNFSRFSSLFSKMDCMRDFFVCLSRDHVLWQL